MRHVAKAALGAAAACCLLLACASPLGWSLGSRTQRAVHVIHGAQVTIEVRDPDRARGQAALEAALAAANEVAGRLLLENETSEIGMLNLVPSHIVVELSEATTRDLRASHAISRETEGAYDPTLRPLLKIWGLEEGSPRKPAGWEIERGLAWVDWSDVAVEDDRPEASRLQRRTALDLADFARGALVDAGLAALRDSDAPAGHVTADHVQGVYAPADRPWSLRIEAEGARLDLKAHTGGYAIVAPHHRSVLEDGLVVHERIDPRTGYPANALQVAVVRAPNAASAAAFAVAAFALGDALPELLETHSDLSAAFLSTDGERWVSPGLAARWR